MLLTPTHSSHSLVDRSTTTFAAILSPSILTSSKPNPLSSSNPTETSPHAPLKCSFNSGPLCGGNTAPSHSSRGISAPDSAGVPTIALCESSLLARRKSNAGVNGIRPLVSALALSDMPQPSTYSDQIHEDIIGPSALADTLRRSKIENGLSPGSVKGLLERAFLGSTKNRKPTPYPEKADPLEQNEDEEDDNEDENGDESREEESDLSGEVDPFTGVDDL